MENKHLLDLGGLLPVSPTQFPLPCSICGERPLPGAGPLSKCLQAVRRVEDFFLSLAFLKNNQLKTVHIATDTLWTATSASPPDSEAGVQGRLGGRDWTDRWRSELQALHWGQLSTPNLQDKAVVHHGRHHRTGWGGWGQEGQQAACWHRDIRSMSGTPLGIPRRNPQNV